MSRHLSVVRRESFRISLLSGSRIASVERRSTDLVVVVMVVCVQVES